MGLPLHEHTWLVNENILSNTRYDVYAEMVDTTEWTEFRKFRYMSNLEKWTVHKCILDTTGFLLVNPKYLYGDGVSATWLQRVAGALSRSVCVLRTAHDRFPMTAGLWMGIFSVALQSKCFTQRHDWRIHLEHSKGVCVRGYDVFSHKPHKDPHRPHRISFCVCVRENFCCGVQSSMCEWNNVFEIAWLCVAELRQCISIFVGPYTTTHFTPFRKPRCCALKSSSRVVVDARYAAGLRMCDTNIKCGPFLFSFCFSGESALLVLDMLR